MKIKILFFVPQLVGGGAERVTMNIIKLLDKKMFDVHLVVTTLAGSRYENFPEGVEVHNLKISRTILSIFQLRKVMKNLKPDLFFSSLIRGHIATYLAMWGMRNKPFSILRSPNSPKLLLKYNQLEKLQKFLLESAYKHANIIVAQTPEMREEIIRYHKIDEQKVKFLLNPLDTDNIKEKTKNIDTPFDEKYVNLVAAGRITYQKGFDILIKSFSHVIKKNNMYRLFIIGEEDIIGKDGVEEEIDKLKRIIKELKLESYVEFLGYQENPYKYFYFSDLYVLSSRWEGLPNTVLENLYLHKPVISTRCIPYMDELIQEGENGFLVEVENELDLANAILEYKSLRYNFSQILDSKANVNNFFKNIKEDV